MEFEKWKTYADAAVPGLKEICLEDLRGTMNAGYSWQEHCLPVLNAVMQDTAKREKAMVPPESVTSPPLLAKNTALVTPPPAITAATLEANAVP